MFSSRILVLGPIVIAIILMNSFPVLASDWPQWQGPDRNAISSETGLLQEWPAGGPSIAWKVGGLGGGDSAPAVAGGKLFGLSNRGREEVVWSLSEKDGKEVWVTPLGTAVDQRVPQSKEGPGGTPSVDGDRVYVIGMSGTLACLNVSTGTLVWKRSLTQEFGGIAPMWNFRESPLVDGDQVICTPGGPEAMIVALNKLTGETIWKSQVPASTEAPAGGSPNRPESSGRPIQSNTLGGNTAAVVTGTKDPELFASEHWGMTGFSRKLPNGKYLVKLFFAETYDGITGTGQRVFTFTVQGKEFKDFDIWEKAGGPKKAYIESIPVELTDGELKITFTRKTENPAIKAIEIVPLSDGAQAAETIRIKAGLATPFKDAGGQVWLADQGFEGGQLSPGSFNFGGGSRPGRFGGPRAGAAYSSVITINTDGLRQYVQLTSSSLVGVAASDGQFLWKYDRPANRMGINCSTPIYQDGLLFAASAYGNGGGAVKLMKNENGSVTAAEVYFSSNMQNHHGGMIVVDGCLYGANGGNEGGFLTCMDFQTGEVLWRDRQAPKGALLLADGRLYLRSESGTMILIEPSKEGFVERGRFEQPDRTSVPAWSHPIVANGKLYIRDQDSLWCYDVHTK